MHKANIEFHVRIVADTRRKMNSWVLSEYPVSDEDFDKLVAAFRDAQDMCLAPRPFLVFLETEARGAIGRVSPRACFARFEQLIPPFKAILINDVFLNFIKGETFLEQLQYFDSFFDGRGKEETHLALSVWCSDHGLLCVAAHEEADG